MIDVLDAITSRFSARAFINKPVDESIVQRILEAASRAPSGVNTQPWCVHILTGNSKEKFSAAILQAREQEQSPAPDYAYYPSTWEEPYKSRRKACGAALYGALDITYGDKVRRLEQWNKNYRFFGAPVGLLIFVKKQLEKGSWIDTALFIQNIMLAARHFDCHTCPQAAIAEYPDIAREMFALSNDYDLICGIALGYANMDDPVNQYRTDREKLETFTRWHH